jgi:hypothetical protein
MTTNDNTSIGLFDAVKTAFEKAQASDDPSDWRVYHALQARLAGSLLAMGLQVARG